MRRTILAALFSVAFSAICSAGQVNDAKINRITVDDLGNVRLTLVGGTDVNPKAGCTSSADGREYTFDISSVSGSAWHSIALTALAAQKNIHIIGKNSCLALWGSTPFEAVQAFYIMN